MTRCATCGDDDARAFEVRAADGTTATFDSFGCAIQRMAPTCVRCGLRVIGHGVEVEGEVFCCAHCARHAGRGGPVDRIGEAGAVGDPTPNESQVDAALEGSFPASDPPSFWAREPGVSP